MSFFEECECGDGGQNTGVPPCVPVIDRTSFMILVQTIANDGTVNSIKATDFIAGKLPDSFIQGKIDETDPSKRWFITPKINAVIDVRAEPVTFDVDGIPKIVDQGIRTFAGSFFDKLGSPVFAGVVNSFKCLDMSEFEITQSGGIAGLTTKDGSEMLPVSIETGTLFAGVVKKTKTELNAVTITFAVNELVRDENLIQISSKNIEPNMLLKKGLVQVVGEALTTPVITATTVRINATFIYGNFSNSDPFESFLAADLSSDLGVTPSTVFNVSTSTQIAVSTLVPVVGSPGEYDMTIAAGAASTNVIQVAMFKSKFAMVPFTYIIP